MLVEDQSAESKMIIYIGAIQLISCADMEAEGKSMHILMYPWFAIGHLSSFLHLANKLASRGHSVSFLLPPSTVGLLQPLNLHPHLISFSPVPVPHLPGSETTSDVPFPLQPLLMTAMDLTRPALQALLRTLRPSLVLFDFAHWLPDLCRALGIACVHYCTVSAATIGYLLSPSRGPAVTHYSLLMNPPPGFPPSKIKLTTHEARGLFSIHTISFQERQMKSLTCCDAIAFKTTREAEGPYCDYIERQFNKPVLLAGPVLPELPTARLEEKWKKWLDRFEARSVVYCAFGSECVLGKLQFQELLLGLELTGKPFLAALKPPLGTEEAFPEGFAERVKERGWVHGGWVEQKLILRHPSVGCFVTHCGSGSLTESQLVLLPDKGDQIINARMMAGELRVGVEVEKGDEDGEFRGDDVSEAIWSVMDEESEMGKEVRINHRKSRELLLRDGFEASYFDSFVHKLQRLTIACSINTSTFSDLIIM